MSVLYEILTSNLRGSAHVKFPGQMWKGSVVDDRARARFSIGFIGKIEETPLLLHVIYHVLG